jgi:hypothetical protein
MVERSGSADRPAEAAPAPAPAELTSAEQREAAEMLDRMRAYLKGQRKVRVRVKNDGPVFCQINGYSFVIRPDVPVEVPEAVAELLEGAGYI